jgi:hypothetical protein
MAQARHSPYWEPERKAGQGERKGESDPLRVPERKGG